MLMMDPTLANSLDRYLMAQEPVYTAVLSELRASKKETHWMWFIFPQMRGLGSSSTSEYFGLNGIAEARAYLNHEILGSRLRQCSDILLTTGENTAYQVFGSPDDLKLGSCMTLFASIAQDQSPFHDVLNKYFSKTSPSSP